MILIVFILILLFSLALALRSMHDFELPNEVKKLLRFKKVQGTIMFFKDKIKHYQK